VQTLTRFTSPSTTARTRWIFGFQVFFVFKWEWLTFMPLIVPLPQISQKFAIGYTSLHHHSTTYKSYHRLLGKASFIFYKKPTKYDTIKTNI